MPGLCEKRLSIWRAFLSSGCLQVCVPGFVMFMNLLCYNGRMKRVPPKRKVRQFAVVIEQDEDDYYVATVPSLPSCYTQARTLQELAPRIRRGILAKILRDARVKPAEFLAWLS